MVSGDQLGGRVTRKILNVRTTLFKKSVGGGCMCAVRGSIWMALYRMVEWDRDGVKCSQICWVWPSVLMGV